MAFHNLLLCETPLGFSGAGTLTPGARRDPGLWSLTPLAFPTHERARLPHIDLAEFQWNMKRSFLGTEG